MKTLIYSRLILVAGLCLLCCATSSCSHFGARARYAAAAAARDPWTWMPVTGAAVIAATNSDKRISHWATTETPVFGSNEAAIDASNRFRRYASDTAWVIFLAAPMQNDGNWFAEKWSSASENLVGLALARSTTGVLKSAAQRERPNGAPVPDSFPSAHSTDAFAHASFARDYIDDTHASSAVREGLQWASNGFAVATAWGRVEGGAHYPTDVLVGAAVANFATRFLVKLASSNPKFNWQVRSRTDANGSVVIELGKPF